MANMPGSPPLAALFLIRFDKRIGYTIAWQKAIDGLSLDGAVEYKSLPSGLHNLKEDLVYFTHGEHAGLSSFRSAPAGEDDRGATFAAVGCLVQKRGGRLGQIWLHAQELEHLSRVAVDAAGDDEQLLATLEMFWEAAREQDDAADISQTPSRSDHIGRRKRAMSESTTLTDGEAPATNHPIHALEHMLSTFGPLIFPLYRAAILRKRLLLMSRPPLRELCDFVYILSILSSIPQTVMDDIELKNLRRSQALFAIGVHDITALRSLRDTQTRDNLVDSVDNENAEADEEESGYIACSSDELLKTKTDLYDVAVSLAEGSQPAETWPVTTTSHGAFIRATARDLRRYKELRRGLWRMQRNTSNGHRMPHPATDDDDAALLSPAVDDEEQHLEEEDRDLHTCVETAPWAAIAYDSFVWWASAGERRTELEDEQEQDRQLLDTAAGLWKSGRRPSMSLQDRRISPVEVALVGYFHKFTVSLFRVLTDLLDDKAEEPAVAGGEVLMVSRADMARMGLDVWSTADKNFVKELVALYYGIEARVQGTSVECCGVRFV